MQHYATRPPGHGACQRKPRARASLNITNIMFPRARGLRSRTARPPAAPRRLHRERSLGVQSAKAACTVRTPRARTPASTPDVTAVDMPFATRRDDGGVLRVRILAGQARVEVYAEPMITSPTPG